MGCEFDPVHYLETLGKYKDSGYEILPVSEYFKTSGEKILLLRHDVDFSLEYAYRMASMERSLGHRSTYYILLHSPHFNPLSARNIGLIQDIHGMGHEIGLHVDSRTSLMVDTWILSEIIGEAVKSYGRHYVTITPEFSVPGLINSSDPQLIGTKYISDSGRHWRERCFCKHINKQGENKLQVLTHPIWWMSSGKGRWDAINRMEDIAHAYVTEATNEYRDILSKYVIDENIR